MIRPYHWEQIGPGADIGHATGSIKVYDDALTPAEIVDSGPSLSRPSARDLADKIEALLAGNGCPITLAARETPLGYGFIGSGVVPSVLRNSREEICNAIELVTGGARAYVTVDHETEETAIALEWKQNEL